MNNRRIFPVAISLLVVGASSCGVVSRTDRTAQAQQEALTAVEDCGVDQGYDFDDPNSIDSVAFTAGQPSALAFDQCWATVRGDERFAGLGITLPSEQYRQVIEEEFAAWACIENSGYDRITPIPLSSEAGYPMSPLAGHFDVADGDDALYAYYETAATCTGRSVEAFQSIDGELTRDLADGTECVEHEHGDTDNHSHGCFSTNSYPIGMEPTT